MPHHLLASPPHRLQHITGQHYETRERAERHAPTMYASLSETHSDSSVDLEPMAPEAPPAATVPWKLLFAIQCDARMMDRVRRYARRVAASVADAGGLGGDACAEELMHDCLVATYAGELTWDPAATSLESYLMSRIRARGRDERRRALRCPTSSLDEKDGDEDEGTTVLDEAEAALRSRYEDEPEQPERPRVFQLREHAVDDQEALAILDAAAAGASSKAEILRATGLSEKEYRNARLRLRRLSDRLLAG
jgi:hypothetical protein